MPPHLKFLHAADLHIDSPMQGLSSYEGAPLETLRGATRRALERLVQLAIDEEVGCLLLAGDVYDGSWKDHSTALFFAEQMLRLKEAGIQVYCLYGNHDAESKMGKKLRLPSNVHVFDHQAAHTHLNPELGIAVHGQSFAHKAVTEDLAAGYPPAAAGLFNIGLLHTGLEGRPGHGNYAPTSLDVLRGKGYDYWALGHIHKREEVCQDPWVVFPGNLQGRHAKETGPKGATLVEVDAGGNCSLTPHALDLVRWDVIRLDAEGCSNEEDLLDLLRSGLDAAIEAAEGRLLAARVEVRGVCEVHRELSADPDHWVAEFRSQALEYGAQSLFLERIKFLTQAPLDLELLRERDDPIGAVARRLDALRKEQGALDELGQGLSQELSGFLKKLPNEARQDEEGQGLLESKALEAALDDVEQLLLMRLSQGEAQ